MDLIWRDIIKKEFETLKVQKQKEIADLLAANRDLIDKEINERQLPCGVWKVREGKELSRGKKVLLTSFGKDDNSKTEIEPFILPMTIPPPSMSMWTAIPRNFISKDSEKLQSLPYLGDDNIDDNFMVELVSSYGDNWPGAKKEVMDDDLFLKLVQSLIPYQNTNVMLASSSQIDRNASTNGQMPAKIIFDSIDSYFNTNNSHDKYITLTKQNFKCSPNTSNIDLKATLEPDQAFNSYQRLFCRRCLIYNCQLHSEQINRPTKSNVHKRHFQEVKKPDVPCSNMCYLWGILNKSQADSVEISGNPVEEIAGNFNEGISGKIIKEIPRKPFEEIAGDTTAHVAETVVKNSESDWTSFDQELQEASINVFPNNSCAIAQTSLSKPREEADSVEISGNPVEEIAGNFNEGISGKIIKEIPRKPFEEIAGDTTAHVAETVVKNSESDWTSFDQELQEASINVFPNNSCAIAQTSLSKPREEADSVEISGNPVEEITGNSNEGISGKIIKEIPRKPFEEIAGDTTAHVAETVVKNSESEWTSFDQELQEASINVFPNNSCAIAQTSLSKPREEIPGNTVEEISGNSNVEIHKKSFEEIPDDSTALVAEAEVKKSDNEWTLSDQNLLAALMKVFPNNSCVIAETMLTKSCEEVYKRMMTIETKTDTVEADIIKKKIQKKKKQSTSYDKTLHLLKNYVPCDHSGLCNKTTECLCLNCDKFCSCDGDCTKRIPKCKCKLSCLKYLCICYDGQRECDPELCGCISCNNIGIQRGLEKKLQIVSSQIHGWGVFIKESCQKFEFIAEYRGEIISQTEADRRGKVYDKLKCTYLFHLNKESVIDATRFGAAFRFSNYSNTPNCITKVMLVNGDHRIGIYASRFIEAGEELTIDYNTHNPTESN